MAYFDNDIDDNANFFSFSTFGEFNEYPFLGQTLATEGANGLPYHTPADRSNMVGSSTSFWATANGKCRRDLFVGWRLTCESPESVAEATSYVPQIDGYGQPSYSDYQWPAVGHQAESYHTGFLSRGTSFAETVASEASTVAQTPSSCKSLFCFETLGIRTLTYREQSRSATGGITTAAHHTARSTR
ncbi:hypothetical protein BDM02DRAFT_3018631 [Thelephora ganbajun]|uniref:Uncharacterized protein n=1 Tax=Thelephora ganbajun TaxID=370292 RepID=A0ACB6ZAD0_THEGA|nr:hypothetical protein BDM02DRAFT_3018631 [Thelephora ganbajun]